jgi:hypothetical protein
MVAALFSRSKERISRVSVRYPPIFGLLSEPRRIMLTVEGEKGIDSTGGRISMAESSVGPGK